MSYLYSKLPETGVPLLIGTGGIKDPKQSAEELFHPRKPTRT